jgi:hypothetical protein
MIAVQSLTPAEVRSSIVNSSRSRRASMTLPTPWPLDRLDERDYLGWVDPKAPQRAYVVLGDDIVPETVGIELRVPTSASSGRTTLCDWCRTDDGTSTSRLLVAARAGARGRAGDTVGVYVCGDLGCWHRARRPLKPHEKSVTGAPDTRVDDLRARVLDLVDRVRAA